VIAGAKSPESMRIANRELAGAIGGRYVTHEGQTHMYKADVLAPALVEALVEGRGTPREAVAA